MKISRQSVQSFLEPSFIFTVEKIFAHLFTYFSRVFKHPSFFFCKLITYFFLSGCQNVWGFFGPPCVEATDHPLTLSWTQSFTLLSDRILFPTSYARTLFVGTSSILTTFTCPPPTAQLTAAGVTCPPISMATGTGHNTYVQSRSFYG